MDIIFLFVVVYLAFRNSVLARKKGKNPIIWVIITIVSYFVAEIIAMCIILFGFFGLTMNKLAGYGNNAQALSNDFSNFLMKNPIHWTFIVVFSFGSYLLIKYILDKMPDVNKGKSSIE